MRCLSDEGTVLLPASLEGGECLAGDPLGLSRLPDRRRRRLGMRASSATEEAAAAVEAPYPLKCLGSG